MADIHRAAMTFEIQMRKSPNGKNPINGFGTSHTSVAMQVVHVYRLPALEANHRADSLYITGSK